VKGRRQGRQGHGQRALIETDDGLAHADAQENQARMAVGYLWVVNGHV
jgi:hypothetical protein